MTSIATAEENKEMVVKDTDEAEKESDNEDE